MRIRRCFTLAALAVAAALTGLGPALAANAATGVTLAFTASPDSTAGWATGTNHPGAVLAVGSCPTTNPACPYGGWAQIGLTGVSRDIATTSAPALAVTNYAAGTPRLELVPEIGPDSVTNDATGYPDTGLCSAPANGICWSLGSSPNSYTATWTQVQTYIHSLGGLKTAYVVADASQTTPYTSDVTALSWNGQALVPGTIANKVSAIDECGNYTNRLWKLVNDSNGITVKVTVWTVLKSGRMIRVGNVTTPPAGALVTTHQGVKLRIHYGNGLGGFVTSTYPATTSAACP